MNRSYPQGYYGRNTNPVNKKIASRLALSYRQELDRFITGLPEGAHVLDVGCGEGRTLQRIQEFRPDLNLYGMDISDVSTLLPDGISFSQGSIEDLKSLFGPNMFDAVICQHVIEHLVTPLELISGIREVLKSGGAIFLETPNWTRLLVPFSFLYFWNDYTHIHPYTSFGLRRMFLEHNFSIAVLRTLSTCSWRSPKQMRKSGMPSEETGRPSTFLPSAFAHSHAERGLIARGFAYAVNPLLRDLLIAIAVKEE